VKITSFYCSGTKKDCMVYGYDVVECDTQLNVYSWSSPPGLREQAAEVSNAIRGGVSSTFQRTVSSSSTTSINKSKRKRAAEKNFNEIGEQTAFNDICTTASSTSTGPSSSSEKRVVDNPSTNSSIQYTSSNSNIQSASSTSSTSTTSTTNTSNNQTSTTNVADVEALLEQIKALEEKNMALQEELIDKQENSIREYRLLLNFSQFTF